MVEMVIANNNNNKCPQGAIGSPFPPRGARHLEMRIGLVQLVMGILFTGLDDKDPHSHLHRFCEVCRMIDATEEEEHTMFLNMFQFSLIGKAKVLLDYMLCDVFFGDHMNYYFIPQFEEVQYMGNHQRKRPSGYYQRGNMRCNQN
ncbi:hypothetical protein Lal_00001443 [Lupinus albus]|nr:hypothetical protein Lal_00001443 [Lupinus albus]